MNLHNYSSSLSLSSKSSGKGDKRNVYKANVSGSSSSKKSSSNKDDSEQMRSRNALDQVDDDNDKNYQLLSNFLKRQDQFGAEEQSDALSQRPYAISPATIFTC